MEGKILPFQRKGGNMIELRLSRDEALVLQETIEYTISEIRMEIAGTESLDWRNELKRRVSILRNLLDQIESQRIVEPA